MRTDIPEPLVPVSLRGMSTPSPVSGLRDPTGMVASGITTMHSARARNVARRALIGMMLSQAIANAVESRTRAAVMLIGFESARACQTPTFFGLDCLQSIATRAGMRPGEWAPIRLAGDSIVVVGSGFQSSGDVLHRGNEWLNAATATCRLRGPDTKPGCVVGIGMFPEDGETSQELIARAEEALADLRLDHDRAAGFSMRRSVHMCAAPRASQSAVTQSPFSHREASVRGDAHPQ